MTTEYNNTEQTTRQSLQAYLNSPLRNHIIFSQTPLAQVEYHNVGQRVATYLQTGGIAAALDCERLLPPAHTSDIGHYRALGNIGILFEPELRLDVRHLLDSLSKDIPVLICGGTTAAGAYLPFGEASQIAVNLSGISFITLQSQP